ncbi:hypothetical protein [Streptomyces kaempferi]|uniref:Uncharacterized protein n=1 Tax=Streptomyces kaempferi TaxID=333725 RepID=A0ABW3XKS0_9ACTN
MTDEITRQILQWGPAGVLVVLLLTRVLVTRPELAQAQADATEWRRLFEAEQGAHRTTQTALEAERKRMDAATESSHMAEMLLRHLGHPTGPPGGGP